MKLAGQVCLTALLLLVALVSVNREALMELGAENLSLGEEQGHRLAKETKSSSKAKGGKAPKRGRELEGEAQGYRRLRGVTAGDKGPKRTREQMVEVQEARLLQMKGGKGTKSKGGKKGRDRD